jgi:phage shock protein PspC (stress-responsive transcriptional regulator)
MEQPKRLYRNRYDTVIAGVAGGLARYFNIDPIIVRIIFVVLAFTGGGVLIYIILWIAVPEDPDYGYYSFDHKKNYKNMETEEPGKGADAGSGEGTTTEKGPDTGPGKDYYYDKYKYNPDYEKKKNDGNLIAGIVFIILGGLFLASRFIPHVHFHDLWPVLLIVGGILIILNSFSKPKNNY